MGNRAAIVFCDCKEDAKAVVYLHYYGSPETVASFLEYCRLREFRTGDYGLARFAQVVGNYIGGCLSLGIYTRDTSAVDEKALNRIDPGDNGVYIVKEWKIERRYHYGVFTDETIEPNAELVREIDSRQPEREQIARVLDAPRVKASTLDIGDSIWLEACNYNKREQCGKYVRFNVVDIEDGDAVINRYEPYDAEDDRTFTYADVPGNCINPSETVILAN